MSQLPATSNEVGKVYGGLMTLLCAEDGLQACELQSQLL